MTTLVNRDNAAEAADVQTEEKAKPTVAKMEDAAIDTSSRHIVPLSGGKDSTALAIYLAQRYPELPFEYVFSDTGAELPETYDYFERLEHVLGRKVTRITALEMLGVAEKPGRSPFDVVLYDHFSGFLPSPRSRWCTRMLKIHPFEKFIGPDQAYSYIAIRADENRSGYVGNGKPVLLSEQPNITPVYLSRMRALFSQTCNACWKTAGWVRLAIMSGVPGRAAISASTSRSASGKDSKSGTQNYSKERTV